MTASIHTFQIPVMGTGFTIDTPLKVACYGISSVVSVVDDHLIERMRRYHTEKAGLDYVPISPRTDDFRARRITAYLNLMHQLVNQHVDAIKHEDFTEGSEIQKYFELLPGSVPRQMYHEMVRCDDPSIKFSLQENLRELVVPGSIDVNIMTKIDRSRKDDRGIPLPPEYSEAKAALRGFAESDLNSSVVFSAGMNQGLYAYAAQFDDFFPNEKGEVKKKIILKVSDYRSALIQGKFLAKKGLWVSEYRIESGLNCGGHAFATKGHLAGPILEEFKENRDNLIAVLHGVYAKSLSSLEKYQIEDPLPVKITYQGGLGTAEEDRFLREYYQVDGTGWGTPFLLVPEVVNVDDDHVEKLCAADENDVELSRCSPLGVPFWNLRTSASEEHRHEKMETGAPGSPCPRKYLVTNTEFSEDPLCLGAHDYQTQKIAELEKNESNKDVREAKIFEVMEKACLCRDLAGGALVRTGLDLKATAAICCGPNISHFDRVLTLKQMVDHIYGRCVGWVRPGRPHFFIKEIQLYVDYMKDELRRESLGMISYPADYFSDYSENLRKGIDYYSDMAETIVNKGEEEFLSQLDRMKKSIENIRPEPQLAHAETAEESNSY